MVSGEMYSMKDVVKRCLSLGSSLSVVLTGLRRTTPVAQAAAPMAANWPMVPKAAQPLAAPATKTIPEVPPLSNFSGTVVRDGSRFALREFDGTLFALDSTGRAWPFEGEDVSISGYFNPDSRLLHICSIAAVDDLRAEAV